MTATQVDEQLRLATQAAEAALAVLPSSSPLQVGTPLPGVPDTVPPGQAVSARFGGTATGEVAVLAGQDLADGLRNRPLVQANLARAVCPAQDGAACGSGPGVCVAGWV